MSQSLDQKICTACEGNEAPLKPEQIDKYLEQIPGWHNLKNKTINREFSLKDFSSALTFINQIGEIAEKEGHHPDIFLHSYKKVLITLSTHAIDGLSENDFIIASKINKLAI